MSGSPRVGRRAARRCVRTLLPLLVAVLPSGPGAAQETGWTGRLFFQALSVRDAGDWMELRQEVGRHLEGGRRFRLGLVQTRRFGTWDASAEAGVVLRPGDLYLSLDARITPEAEILEDAFLGGRAALPVGEVVPSVGYRLRLFADGPVHSVSPRLEWYRGPWLLSGELRLIRSAVETMNIAGIIRITRRLSADWRVWIGGGVGEEDFLVGRPPSQQLRTLDTRSLFGGIERALADGWTVRLDVSGVDSDPRLDRVGGALTVTRAF